MTKRFAAALAFLALAAGSAHADTMTFNTVDNGWYRSDGFYAPGNKNTITGVYAGQTYNSFYNFDLSGLPAGKSITSASITFVGGNGGYYSTDPSETVEIWDVSNVPGTDSSVAIFNDLMSGKKYGETKVYGQFGSMPGFSVTLGQAAFADMLDGSFFSLGAHLSSIGTGAYSGQETLWSSSGAAPAAFLTLEVTDAGAVPEPSSLALLGIAAAGLIRVRRQKRA